MNLDAFGDAVLSEARDEARRRIDEAEAHAQQQLADARRRASDLVEEARTSARHAVAREMHRRHTEARRHAREQVLRARQEILEQLRTRVLDLLDDWRSTGEYERFEQHLRSMARGQLGDRAEMIDAEDGGVMARLDRRVVDYRLRAVVDRALDELADELEELWR